MMKERKCRRELIANAEDDDDDHDDDDDCRTRVFSTSKYYTSFCLQKWQNKKKGDARRDDEEREGNKALRSLCVCLLKRSFMMCVCVLI